MRRGALLMTFPTKYFFVVHFCFYFSPLLNRKRVTFFELSTDSVDIKRFLPANHENWKMKWARERKKVLIYVDGWEKSNEKGESVKKVSRHTKKAIMKTNREINATFFSFFFSISKIKIERVSVCAWSCELFEAKKCNFLND